MHSRPERVIGHTGTETRSRLLRESSSRESSAMGESLTEQRRVSDEGLRIVKTLLLGKNICVSNCAHLDGT